MAFRPIKQWKIAVDGGAIAETATALAHANVPTTTSLIRQAMLYAKNTDIVVKFGDSTVTADATLTSLKMPDRNFVVPAGAVMIVNLHGEDTHFSAIAEDETTATGVLFLALGFGENV